MNMKLRLFNVLSTFDFPVFLQGTISENEPYPESFITFFTEDTEDRNFFDNEVNSIDWTFSVIFYTSEPNRMSYIPRLIIETLKMEGFIPQGRGRDIPSDVPTHTGWAMEFIAMENKD